MVSLGPSEREVPAVVGLPVEEATKALEALKLRVATEQAFSETAAPGVVLTQFPEAGTKVPAGSDRAAFREPWLAAGHRP